MLLSSTLLRVVVISIHTVSQVPGQQLRFSCDGKCYRIRVPDNATPGSVNYATRTSHTLIRVSYRSRSTISVNKLTPYGCYLNSRRYWPWPFRQTLTILPQLQLHFLPRIVLPALLLRNLRLVDWLVLRRAQTIRFPWSTWSARLSFLMWRAGLLEPVCGGCVPGNRPHMIPTCRQMFFSQGRVSQPTLLPAARPPWQTWTNLFCPSATSQYPNHFLCKRKRKIRKPMWAVPRLLCLLRNRIHQF